MTDEQPPVANNHKPLTEVLRHNEVVDVGEDYVIVTPRTYELAEDDEERPKALRQISAGMGGTGRFAEVAAADYNPDFSGAQAIERYREMKNDGQIRNSLRMAKMPVLGARWFMRPASNDPRDVEIANAVWKNLTRNMTASWQQILMESLLMIDYGWYVLEKVFDYDEQGNVIWRKFVPVHPLDIEEPIYDEKDGGIEGVRLADERESVIPVEKLLIFTYDKEGGNVLGHSALRSAAKHWFFKENLYKIDGIQKERHGVGIPIIKLPLNHGPNDKNNAHAIGRNLRSNESAHVVIPPTWEIEFAKLEGQRVDALESAQYHGRMIYENVVGQFGDEDDDENKMFLKSARYTAEIVLDVWNRYAIPQLVKWNWEVEDYPQLGVRRLGDESDWRQMSFAIRNLIGAGMVTPSDKDEDWARSELDMPEFDPNTARVVENRQVPGSSSPSARTGPAQQSPVASQQQGTGNAGRTGRDVRGQ